MVPEELGLLNSVQRHCAAPRRHRVCYHGLYSTAALVALLSSNELRGPNEVEGVG